ncbi:MAG: response regulator transcription factor [Rhodobacteraceae bacterium]|nr:response regulator transcription factor [Paracoccaceae bacterium]
MTQTDIYSSLRELDRTGCERVRAVSAISVACFDDHPLLLSGLAGYLASVEGFDLVATGSTTVEARLAAGRLKIDVMILDLNMPTNVIEAISDITAGQDAPRILVFTASTVVNHAVVALEAGARGFVLKGSPKDELATAIRTIHAGDTYITPSFAAKVVAGIREAAEGRSQAAARFSHREEQVLRLLLQGSTNRSIADHLEISEKTVKHYMSVLMQKLNVRNRIEVVLAAQELERRRARSDEKMFQ